MTVSVSNTQVIQLIWRDCVFDDKSARRMGYMTHSAILPVTSPNVHQCEKFFHHQSEW